MGHSGGTGNQSEHPDLKIYIICLMVWFCWAVSLLFGRIVVSVVTENRWLRPLIVLVRLQLGMPKEHVNACNNHQTLIVVHVPPSFGSTNLPDSSPMDWHNF
jgi:hypothetical protein